jgi:NADH:ubiquinone oxidoreductase subunit F (NADH-binding)
MDADRGYRDGRVTLPESGGPDPAERTKAVGCDRAVRAVMSAAGRAGAVLAAELVGAREAVVVVRRRVRQIMDEAAAERRRAHLDRVGATIRTAADRFAGGKASAVVHWIDRGVPTPTAKPPRMSARGLSGRPTLVHNVETLAHLALIARYGAAWFRFVGTAAEPGSMLVTALGAVHQPCALEIAIGTPLGQVLSLAGGPSAPLQALLLGGYFGGWVNAADAAGRPFSSAGLADLGTGTGAGLIAGAARRRVRDCRDRPGDALPGRGVRRAVRAVPVRPGRDGRRTGADR